MKSPILVLSRGNHSVGYYSELEIYLDDRLVGTVRNNGRFQIEVAHGKHSLFVKMNWCKSPSQIVHFPLNTMVAIRCNPPADGFFALFSMIVNPSNFFTLEDQKNYPID